MRAVPKLAYSHLGVASRVAYPRVLLRGTTMSNMITNRRLYSHLPNEESSIKMGIEKNTRKQTKFSSDFFQNPIPLSASSENIISFQELDEKVRSTGKFVLSPIGTLKFENLTFDPKNSEQADQFGAKVNDDKNSKNSTSGENLKILKSREKITPEKITEIEESFHKNLKLNRYKQAKRNFNLLSKVKPDAICKDSCLRLARQFYEGTPHLNVHRTMRDIYLFMNRQKMDIPLDFYNDLLNFSYYSSIDSVEGYYVAALEKFGVENLPVNMTKSLFRAYLRNQSYQKVVDHYGLLASVQLPFNINYLKPFFMEATFATGNEKKALELFYDYLKDVKFPARIASAYSRLAGIYCRSGRVEDGFAVIKAYRDREYPNMVSILAISARVQILRGDLEAAYDELLQKSEIKDSKAKSEEDFLFLTECFKHGREDLAFSYVEKLIQHFDPSNSQTLSKPLALAFQYISFKYHSMEKVEQLFSLLPKDVAYKNQLILRQMLFSYLRCGDIHGAKSFYENVVSNGITTLNRFENVEKCVQLANRKYLHIKYILGEEDYFDSPKEQNLPDSKELDQEASSVKIEESAAENKNV